MKLQQPCAGMFVCFEGGDAAGKTTLASSVIDELHRRGLSPVLVDKKSIEGFEDPYLTDRMRDLRRVLWDYPQDAPIWEWGDHHWFHLIVSWFSVLDRCKIQPLLRQGRCVIVDSWYYKLAARFLLKPHFERSFILSSFAHLTPPDLVILVDVAPQVAATRRETFSATESGRMDGHVNGDAEDFVNYQERVLAELRLLGDDKWVAINATHSSLEELVSQASDAVSARRGQPAGQSRRKINPVTTA
jgi:dTMP kinase